MKIAFRKSDSSVLGANLAIVSVLTLDMSGGSTRPIDWGDFQGSAQ